MNLAFGIIGCGRIANRHTQQIARIGQLKAACDVDVDRCIKLEPTAKPYNNADEMLRKESLDIVSICSPNGLHATHAIASLKAGCHVICEKPMALTASDCGKMITAAERANRRLFIVKQNRFNPPIARVQQLVANGDLGQIYSVQLNCFWNRNPAYYKDSWKGSLSLDGGTLFTQFSHFIDLLHWMFGDVSLVEAYGDNFNHGDTIEFEDTGVAILKFATGALATINYTVNSYAQNMEGSLTVFGERGTVKIGGQYLNELEYLNSDSVTIDDLPPGNPPNLYGTYVGSMSNHGAVYDNVVEVLRGDGAISTGGYEGLKTVEIIERIYGCIR